jgi:tRNA nucleotidyltransferase/poly(A) polymerase
MSEPLRFAVTQTPPEEISSQNWELVLTSYGYRAVFCALNKLEQDGYYEECRRLVESLRNFAEMIDMNLPELVTVKTFGQELDRVTKDEMGIEMEPMSEDLVTAYCSVILNTLGYGNEYSRLNE